MTENRGWHSGEEQLKQFQKEGSRFNFKTTRVNSGNDFTAI